MGLIRKILFWSLALLMLLVPAMFVLLNRETVSVDLLFVQLPNVWLSVLVVGVFIVGALVGFLVGAASLLKANATNQVMKMKLGKLEREQEKLSGKHPVEV